MPQGKAKHRGAAPGREGQTRRSPEASALEEIAEALRQRAARDHPSLQGELMAILHAAVRPPSASRQAADERKLEGRRASRTIEDLARESP